MIDDQIEQIDGFFRKIIYRTDNYMVSVFETEEDEIIVTGPFFEIEKSTKYQLTGKYVNHQKYGFQFEMMTAEKYLPEAKEEIVKFLSGPTFKSIGKKTAEKIYEYFGNDTLVILKEDSSKIYETTITTKQKEFVIEGFNAINDSNSEALFSLIMNGYTNNEAYRIFGKFKSNTLNQLKENPYKFYLDCYGVSFQKVIECSKKIEIDNKESKYKEALLVYLYKELSFRQGDTYLTYDELKKCFCKYYEDFEDVLNLCINEEYFVDIDNRIYLKSSYDDEFYIANYLINNNRFIDIDTETFNIYIKDIGNDEGINYDDSQINAIYNFFRNDFSMIIGGPGTGKTTIIKAITKLYSITHPYESIMVIAPTGRAAKRINEICDIPSKTIHSLLRWNKDDNTFVFNEDNPILYDALIIDEFSMVDNELFAALLKASGKVKKICIIGDDNQLPSIRQGNLLKDLINTNQFNITKLNNIYRQKEGSEIIDLAGQIANNSIDFSKYSKDIMFINIDEFSIEKLIEMINNDFSVGVDLDEIQVLAPMYRGHMGIDYLNLNLQNAFNPKDKRLKEKRVGTVVYREGDKILQLKNRPDDDVYNGDIGFLESIDDKEKNMLINYNGVYIYYSYEDLNEISLAYSLSVHKSQGSEYQNIYFIFTKGQEHMLNKNLIYTAISRAKSKLVIIGDRKLFIESCLKEIKNRKTTLKDIIMQLSD